MQRIAAGFSLIIFAAVMGRIVSYGKAVLALAAFLPALAACDSFKSEGIVGENLTESFVDVTFDVKHNGASATKSSLSSGENDIRNLAVLAYSGGSLETETLLDEVPESLKLKLVKNGTYDLYAVANVEDFPTFPLLEKDIGEWAIVYSSLEELDYGFPMVWSSSGFVVYGGSPKVTMELDRLVCRIDFSIDASALGGVEVTSVRLCQSAGSVRPFQTGGSCCTEGDVILDGDYASDADLQMLNAGLPITLYTLENMHGDLLPDNTDPWAKVPDNIDESDLCTYLEVQCELAETSPLEGSVEYRFYLGSDNTSNFDVERNTDVSVVLYSTSSGVFELSWKVDLDGGYKDGLVDGGQTDETYDLMHKYIGQKFDYELTLDERLEQFLGQVGDGSYSLRYEAASGSDSAVSVARSADGLFSCLCLEAGDGYLCLYDSLDHKIAELDHVTVKTPWLQVGQLSGNHVVTPEIISLAINDAPETVGVYITSDEGNNLYTSDDVFDISLFGLSVGVENDEDYSGVDDSFSYESEFYADGALAKLAVSFENPGDDYYQCLQLTKSLDGEVPIRLLLDDPRHPALSGCYDMQISMLPIELDVYDVENDAFASLVSGLSENYQRRWEDGVAVHVVNPSNLPLSCSYVTGAGANGSVTGSGSFSFEGSSLSPSYSHMTDVASMTYESTLANAFVTVPETMSFNKMRAEPWYTLDDGSEVYEMTPSDLLYSAVRYSSYPGELLCYFNNFSVWLTYDESYSLDGKATVSDILADGSAEFGTKYGRSSGYWDRGVMLWDKVSTQTRCSEALEDSPVALRNFSPAMVSEAASATPLEFVLSKDSEGRLSLSCSNNTNSKSFTVSVTGQIDASVTVHPNGTWGAAKTYTAAYSFSSSKTITPSSAATPLESLYSGFIKAMQNLYSATYTDSNNKIGSSDTYPHRMHPAAITMEVKVTSTEYGLYPLKISSENIEFYHAQEAKTYTITPSVSGSELYTLTVISGL